jgi:hypothetical protein
MSESEIRSIAHAWSLLSKEVANQSLFFLCFEARINTTSHDRSC